MESAATKESEVHVAMPWNRDSKTADLQGHQVGELPQRRCKVFGAGITDAVPPEVQMQGHQAGKHRRTVAPGAPWPPHP